MKNVLRIALLALSVLLFGLTATAQDDAPDLVVIPGTIQSVLGCPGDWQPECEATALAYDERDDLWSATFTLPPGEYEYKVALEGTWTVNYGLNAQQDGPNIPLVLEEETEVRFIYHHGTHWVTDSVNSLIVNVPGNYQDEIGCGGEWAPDCLRSLLQDPDGDGVYVYTAELPAGTFEAKVAANESWDLNWGDGGAQNGPNIPFTVAKDGQKIEFQFDTSNNVATIIVGGQLPPSSGNLTQAQAHWVSADTIAWSADAPDGSEVRLYYSPTAELVLSDEGLEGGEYLTLTPDDAGIGEGAAAKFPHLAGANAYKLSAEDAQRAPELLRGQLAVVIAGSDGAPVDATGLQIPGVLDDLYATDAPLGLIFGDGNAPLFNLWAPTAQNVRVHLFADSDPASEAIQVQDMVIDPATGAWQYWGEPSWYGQYYLFEVVVYAPSTGLIETNLVTDPYSVSLAMNSTRSQIISLSDPETMPDGWPAVAKPALEAPEDIVLYELHVRDFSIYDGTVPEQHRGKFLAFTDTDSAGMQHLRGLAESGLTHLHLLPVFDIATINEDANARIAISPEALEGYAPNGEEQQALINSVRDDDGFNWGYDPLHYTVPEGSYSTDPDGAARIREFRQMVQSLNENGLRVVMDVVYNHTNASGQSELAVLDRIVPGYYHRLSPQGRVETSTCCANTATEHAMMERLMLDSLRVWAVDYKVDGFRFDLMGHHMRSNMENVRAMLDSLSVETDGVDGSQIYVYGEGWNFGEVADNARGVNATQLNMDGTGIGTFNDRVRDAVRGGSPFGGLVEQGFATSLVVDPNSADTRTDAEKMQKLLLFQDQIRVALAGNLADYSLTDRNGEMVTGADVDYNGNPAGYTADPQEHIVYVEAHDNETFFDVIQTKSPESLPLSERIRMHNLGIDLTMLSQGVPFFHAGIDMLRSKSGDKDSYNSGDWFNFLDFSYQDNGWGRGLPIADKNSENWPLWGPLLANPDLQPTESDTLGSVAHFQEMLSIRRSSPLFRLRTAEQITQIVSFPGAGAEQMPGVIVMALTDPADASIDSEYAMIVVVFNATPETVEYTLDTAAGMSMTLHPVQVDSADAVVSGATFDPATGTFSVPGRTTAVFVAGDQS
ncbi:MAG: pullulanase-type alpha-1,6-glucosidase [Chloroflexi bacterium]|nr:pullulanase-type alpha-1,6-glucosidase [Chloroflexota bacterium]